MQYAINLGMQLLPFVIIIIVSIVLRKVMIKFLGEVHPINAYVLVIIPVMAVLLGVYVVARPMFVGQRSYEVPANSPMAIASGNYIIDEAWRKNGIKDIKIGDVIVYKSGTKKAFDTQSTVPTMQCGRVIGLPGNRLQGVMVETGGRSDFVLEIDGRRVSADQITGTEFSGINDVRCGLTVPEGSLWVVLDKGRRMGVFDTDSPYVGPVREGQILGTIHAWSQKDFGAAVQQK